MLYLIKSGEHLKIGYTINLKKRIKQYLTHNPSITVLYTREGTASDEYFLHKILSKYLVGDTEWMRYDKEIIDTFNSIKLNHKESIKKDSNKRSKQKRQDNVKKIIEKKRKYKENNTIFIDRFGNKKHFK
jgi:predicted RNase H-like nuclease (RuvC/YqgF family)|nr:MAG TPA: hypothetical protein [Caudoviricetes sp.]